MAITVVFASLALHLTPATADDSVRVTAGSIDTSAQPRLRFVVTAVDRNGRPLPNLTAQNFSVSAGNRQIPVAAVQTLTDAQIGISSLLVLDTSGSMAGQPIAAAREAATLYVDSLQGPDEVAIISFANAAAMPVGFTRDFSGARAALSGLAAQGNTALYQAVSDASLAVRDRPNDRKVVLLLSDGADFGGVSRASRQESLEAARGSTVPFYVVGLGPSIDRQYLQELADATSGRLFIAPNAGQLQRLYAEIAELLRTQYVVTLDASGTRLQGDVKARLVVQSGSDRGEAELRFTLPVVLIPEPVQPIEVPAGRGITIPTWFSLFLGALAATGGLIFGGSRLAGRLSFYRRQPPPPPIFDRADSRSFRTPAAGDDSPVGRLVGPNGETWQLGRTLVTLGTSALSTFRLPLTESDFGQDDIRIWQAHERFIIHDAAARPRVRVNGKLMGWSFLDDGDVIEVGGVHLRFQSLEAAGRKPEGSGGLVTPRPFGRFVSSEDDKLG